MFREDGFNMFLSYTLCVLVSTLNVYIQSYDAFSDLLLIGWFLCVFLSLRSYFDPNTTNGKQHKFKLTLDYMTSFCIDPLRMADSATTIKTMWRGKYLNINTLEWLQLQKCWCRDCNFEFKLIITFAKWWQRVSFKKKKFKTTSLLLEVRVYTTVRPFSPTLLWTNKLISGEIFTLWHKSSIYWTQTDPRLSVRSLRATIRTEELTKSNDSVINYSNSLVHVYLFKSSNTCIKYPLINSFSGVRSHCNSSWLLSQFQCFLKPSGGFSDPLKCRLIISPFH